MDGEIDGLGPKRHRGHARWVRDVFVWTKAPFLFRNEVDGQRPARPDEVKHLGDHPVVIRLRSGNITVEIAARGEGSARLLGSYRTATAAATATAVAGRGGRA